MLNSLTFRYECIENDLLGPLKRATHNIAPYKSKGVERASELSVYWDSDQSLRSMKTCNADGYRQWDSTANGASSTFLNHVSFFICALKTKTNHAKKSLIILLQCSNHFACWSKIFIIGLSKLWCCLFLKPKYSYLKQSMSLLKH